MASNVFGNPITNSTLEGMPEYAFKTITRMDRAHVALNMKNEQNKYHNARMYVENLKNQSGDGVKTVCLIYNATGDTVKFVTSHDWFGNIGHAPYPEEIANGQWGAFLHVKTAILPTGSVGAVVYGDHNKDENGCDWMLAWDNPWNRVVDHNKVYTEILEAGHFNDSVWGVINDKMSKSSFQHSDTWNGCLSSVATGNYTAPIIDGILTLENAA